MSSEFRFWKLSPAVVCLLLAAGCGGSDGPPIVPAGGTVLYNSKPLEGAVVVLTPDGGGRTARGTTDAEGRFQLTTSADNDGAVVGKHTVTVSKREEQAPLEAQDPNRPPIPDARPPAKSLIPARYSELRQTPLTATVEESGENKFEFSLTD